MQVERDRQRGLAGEIERWMEEIRYLHGVNEELVGRFVNG